MVEVTRGRQAGFFHNGRFLICSMTVLHEFFINTGVLTGIHSGTNGYAGIHGGLVRGVSLTREGVGINCISGMVLCEIKKSEAVGIGNMRGFRKFWNFGKWQIERRGKREEFWAKFINHYIEMVYVEININF